MKNGPNVRYDYDNDNNILRSYTALGVDGLMYVTIGGETYHYHTDHLGSVVAITDEDGNVVNRYDYDAFGNFELTCPMMDGSVPAAGRKPCIPNRYTYTGREWDEDAQMYFYRARWYAPSIQRFISEDIVSRSRKYHYAFNNPLCYIDKYGDTAEPPDTWPDPFSHNDDWKWDGNDQNPDDVDHPGNWNDEDKNRWTWHPEDKDHDFSHWDVQPPKGKKGRKKRYLEDGTEVDKDGNPIESRQHMYDMIDDAYELPPGLREITIALIIIFFTPRATTCPANI